MVTAKVKYVSVSIEMPMQESISKIKVDDLERWYKYFEERKDQDDEYLECFNILKAAKKNKGLLKKISTRNGNIEIVLVFKNVQSFCGFVQNWEK